MELLATMKMTAANALSGPHMAAPMGPPMDVMMMTGFMTSLLTLLLWMYQRQYRWCLLALAACLMTMMFYSFLAGAWPVGLVMGVWAGTYVRQWWNARKPIRLRTKNSPRVVAVSTPHWESASRVSRLFGRR